MDYVAKIIDLFSASSYNADMAVQLLHDCICNATAAVHGCPAARTSTTQHCTCCSWLANDTSSFGVVVIGEVNLDNGNHFLNKIYRISPKQKLISLVLLGTRLVASFF
jgi:hypothetical protein